MATVSFTHTCPACGTEQDLQAIVGQVLDDDEARRLVADVLCINLPLGGLVLRYLRLHKPAKQKLRLSVVRAVLGELVPAIMHRSITRKGRDWAVPADAWQTAFHALFDAQAKGTLELPLSGNAYLFEVVMRQADRSEAAAERDREGERRHRAGPVDPGAAHAAALAAMAVGQAESAAAAAAATHAIAPPAAARCAATPTAPAGPSLYARKVQAEIRARLGRNAPTAAELEARATESQPNGEQP